MPKIKHINASDLGIQTTARRFIKENPKVRLFDVLDSLTAAEVRSLEKESFTYNNGRGHTSVIELNLAVAYAQERLRRKNKEWKVLNRLIKQNFPSKEREDAVRNIITKLTDSLFRANERDDINFLNYLIERLKFISRDKKEVFFDNKDDNASIDIGIIDDDLSSGENGFILNSLDAEEIIDLFVEAAITPWRRL